MYIIKFDPLNDLEFVEQAFHTHFMFVEIEVSTGWEPCPGDLAATVEGQKGIFQQDLFFYSKVQTLILCFVLENTHDVFISKHTLKFSIREI